MEMNDNNETPEDSTKVGDFMENRVLKWTPITFSAQFIRKMRKERTKLLHIPSTRQAVAIPKFLTATYYRKNSLLPEDFIKAAKLTTPIEDQKIAERVAFEILFPSKVEKGKAGHGSGNISATDFLKNKDDASGNFMDNLLSDLEDVGIDMDALDIDRAMDDNLKELDSIMDFVNQLYGEAAQGNQQFQSMVDILEQRGGFSDLMVKGVNSVKSALDMLREIIQSEVNALSPGDIQAAVNLGWENDIMEQAKAPWIDLVARYLSAQPDFQKSLERVMNEEDVATAAKTARYLSDAGFEKTAKKELLKDLVQRAKYLNDIREISNALGKMPSFSKDDIFQNSLNQDLSQAFQAARALDKDFNKGLTDDLFSRWQQSVQEPTLSNTFETQNMSANWESMLNDVVSKKLNGMRGLDPSNASREMTRLAQQLMDMAKQSHYPPCNEAFQKQARDAGMNALQKAPTIPDFLSSLKDLLQSQVPFSGEQIMDMGKANGVPEDTLLELLGGNYKLLKSMFEKKIGNFDRYFEIMKNLGQLTSAQRDDLMETALDNNNIQGLGALAHDNMGQTFNSAKKQGREAVETTAGSLTVGPGDNLVLQWFLHRHNIPTQVKDFVRKLTKDALIKIAMDMISSQKGTGEKGLIPTNKLRVFIEGDDMSLVDIDATIENIVMSGKSPDMITPEDLLVVNTEKGRVSICFLLDISGSMGGMKLAACSIAVVVLIGSLDASEVAISFFESNTHVVKEFGDERELDEVADELLDLRAMGGTQVKAALDWGARQLQGCTGEMKICFMLTDCMFSESRKTLVEGLDGYVNERAKFILGVNTGKYNKSSADTILETTKGELVKITNIPDIPKVLTEVLDKIG